MQQGAGAAAASSAILDGPLQSLTLRRAETLDAPEVLPYGVDDLFPLGIGSQWLFDDVSPTGEVTRLEKTLIRCDVVSFTDCNGLPRSLPTIVQRTPDLGDNDGEDSYYDVDTSEATLDEKGLLRAYQADVVNGATIGYDVYTPGYVRLMPPPYTVGRIETYETERCRCREGVCAVGLVIQEHEVLPMTTITVPAGTFEAVGIERRNLGNADVEFKRHWYAPGVGRVLEERLDADGVVVSYEALTSYVVGTGTCQ